jgi:hypothetical protein
MRSWKSGSKFTFGRSKKDCESERPIGDVTEAETHQAADVEVMEMNLCK